MYILFSDDVAYVSVARNWQRTVSHLFEPHNTHIVPAWRVLTWVLVTAAGSLQRLPPVLAVASFSILIAVMILLGRLVARETGRTSVGLAAMALVGTTSVMLVPAIWYSAGQTLWAGFGILTALWYAQSYRRSAKPLALVLAGLAAAVAGWFWTVGHVAGPVAAVYLWTDGRRRCRLAAAAPLAATALAVALTLALGGRRIDTTFSFHGRDARTAADPVQGLLHTCQAIPENLAFGNLGLTVHTTAGQGVLLTLCIFAAWTGRWWADQIAGGYAGRSRERLLGPLESAGAAIVISAYMVEWTFRGYMDFQFLRTINLRFIVPWYDSIPQIGAVLFLAGWWNSRRSVLPAGQPPASPQPPSRLACLCIGLLIAVLIGLNRPRVDELVRATVAPLFPSERELLALPRLQTMRANVLLIDQAEWQRSHLRRLDQCEEIARRMGWGRDAIRAAFGHRFIQATVGALPPGLQDLYDAAAVLDLPDRGRPVDPWTVRAALGKYFVDEPPPEPRSIAPKQKRPHPNNPGAPG